MIAAESKSACGEVARLDLPWDLIYVEDCWSVTTQAPAYCAFETKYVGVLQTDGLQRMFPGKCGTCICQTPIRATGSSRGHVPRFAEETVNWLSMQTLNCARVRASGLTADLKGRAFLFRGWTLSMGLTHDTIFGDTLQCVFLYVFDCFCHNVLPVFRDVSFVASCSVM